MLFLQGLATPFFHRLGRMLAARGARVLRINLTAGDWFLWHFGGFNYRGTLADWPAYLENVLAREGVTDIVCFGDQRRYHQAALAIARRRGLATHVFEEGYLRPNWITLEATGTNGCSTLPRDPAGIIARAPTGPTPEDTLPPKSTFFFRMRWEMTNLALTVLLSPAYPHYVRHRPWHPLVELWGWSKRAVGLLMKRGHALRRVQNLWALGVPYFIYPLQLDSDTAVQVHSDFASNQEAAEVIFASFAAHAPSEARLLVKVHPLDNGLVNRERQMADLTRRHGLEGRVVVIDGGPLAPLLDRAAGVVLINSTFGMSALHHGRAVKALGRAIYDIPGLTFQGPLDDLWTTSHRPDTALYRAFVATVIADSQIRGHFLMPEGIEIALPVASRRILAACPPHDGDRAT